MTEYEPLEMADFFLVQIGKDGKPECTKHGAMNKVSMHGYWRCTANCRAGCKEVESK